jgi:CheY-like chemotaxis protein
LPKMDGYELARRLREISPRLRIIAVTGFGQASDRARSQAAGFDEHIVKPVTLDLLRQLVANK